MLYTNNTKEMKNRILCFTQNRRKYQRSVYKQLITGQCDVFSNVSWNRATDQTAVVQIFKSLRGRLNEQLQGCLNRSVIPDWNTRGRTVHIMKDKRAL